ncbi:hypothetical protein LTR66_009663 [Elasticomyces elasticus]|nr:hypothetical protein LTR66_009663 [Elasticomyces elasticus]
MDLIDAAQLLKVQKLVYAADLFYLIVVYLSKISVVFLFMRLSQIESHTRVAWAVLASCAALCAISVFLAALHCDLQHPWIQYTVKCTSLAAQWTAVAVFDIVTELALFGMAVQLVAGLLTKWPRKGRVVVAFGLRLPVVALAIVRLYYIHKQTRSANPTLQAAITAILTQLEMYYAIMGATIPCLRPFLSGFETNFGAMGADTVIAGSQLGDSGSGGATSNIKRTKGSFAMGSMASSPDTTLSTLTPGANYPPTTPASTPLHPTYQQQYQHQHLHHQQQESEPVFRPDNVNSHTSVTHTHVPAAQPHNGNHHRPHDSSSIASNDSTKMIIKKEVEWQVDSGTVGGYEGGEAGVGGAGEGRARLA